jgi:outer membrane protein OmpA-like peptidoglycan-associated protein
MSEILNVTESRSFSPMNKVFVSTMVAALGLSTMVGCASKKYVRNETAPTITNVNELDEQTAKNSNAIKDVDARATSGIQSANQKADVAGQHAASAQQSADQAQQLASTASGRVDQLANQVANLDNYRDVTDATVHFGFNKANLTPKAKGALDQLAEQLGGVKNYLVVVDGNTDQIGSAEYNYELSKRRADAVVNYLASKYNVPAHKFYLIGLGKDKLANDSKDSKARAENRRVEVRLMTNIQDQGQTAQAQPQGN